MTRSLLALALAGCDDLLAESATCPPAFSSDETGACVFDEDAVAALVRTFEDAGFVKINAEPFLQIYGTQIERNVWVTPLRTPGLRITASDLYAAVDPDAPDRPLIDDFPVGTVIVHEAIDRTEGHGVRVKREPGWDSEDGHSWWFGKIFDDGTPDENECSPCTDCHGPSVLLPTEGLVGVTREAM